MPGAKEIRGKIASIKNTQKITKAMEMVAASKIRKAQDRMRAARPYAEKIRKIVGHLRQVNLDYKHPFTLERPVEAVGLIVVSTDRGLAGALNANLFKSALASIRDAAELRRTGPVLLLTVLAFFVHQALHVEPATVALTGAAVGLLVTRIDLEEALSNIEWTTIFFFVALFVMVGALEATGPVSRLTCNGNVIELTSNEMMDGRIKTKAFGDVDVHLATTATTVGAPTYAQLPKGKTLREKAIEVYVLEGKVAEFASFVGKAN